jgi:hypothetical protein
MRNALQCFAKKENALHDVAILACKAYVQKGMRVRARKNALQCFARKKMLCKVVWQCLAKK